MHAEPGTTNVISKRCDDPSSCDRLPSFAFEGKQAHRCKEHADVGMTDVRIKRCDHPSGCTTAASFGTKGRDPERCKAHADLHMMHVGSKPCEDPSNCTTRSSYGIPGQPPNRCAAHKTAGMLPRPRARCTERKCKQLALYGLNFQERCEDHKRDDDLNLVHRDCAGCKLPNILDTDGFCGTCHPDFIKRVRLAKQREVKAFLDAHGIKYISYDKQLDGGVCGRERPDFVIDCGTHWIILEVDENQHRHGSYLPDCEMVRMKNITSSCGLPVFWIRFNPDSYKPAAGNKPATALQRRELLLQHIRFYADKPAQDASEYCRVEYLFYDGFDASKVGVELLSIL